MSVPFTATAHQRNILDAMTQRMVTDLIGHDAYYDWCACLDSVDEPYTDGDVALTAFINGDISADDLVPYSALALPHAHVDVYHTHQSNLDDSLPF